MVGGVNSGLDLALFVQVHNDCHGLSDELTLRVQVPQVKAAHRAVPLDQTQGVYRELLVPGLSHRKQVLLLACQHVSSTCRVQRQTSS